MAAFDSYDLKNYFEAISNGDENAYATVFNLYKERVFGVAFKMLKSETNAEEIVQETFLSLWNARSNLDDIESPEGYLFTITYNTIYTHLKRASRDKTMIDAIMIRMVSIHNNTQDEISGNETQRLINEVIQRLPTQQRKVYEFSRNQGLSYEQIAEEMGISKNTVRNHLSEAMKTIQRFLRKTIMLLYCI